MNQLFQASTLFGAMNLAAAIDSGLFGDVAEHDRVLLVSTNSIIPESTLPLDEMPGFSAIADRWDRVANWNALIAPHHPSETGFVGEPTIVAPWLASVLDFAPGPIELVLESIQVPPARALADLFVAAGITIYSDGLMSYGPTRVRLPPSLGQRIDRVVHLDLLPGVVPRLLSEFGVPAARIPDDAFRSVLTATAAAAPTATRAATELRQAGATALVLGQYLGSLGIVSQQEEEQLYTDIVVSLAERGHGRVAFKAHPTAAYMGQSVQRRVASMGVDVLVVPGDVALEHVLESWVPTAIAGCFSTGLLVANRFYGVPAFTSGARMVLDRLQPIENSNRVPLTLIDAALPNLSGNGATRPSRSGPQLQDIADVVSFLMQPGLQSDRRDQMMGILAGLDQDARTAYVDEARLEQLGLGTGAVRGRVPSFARQQAMRVRRVVGARPKLARSVRKLRARVTPIGRRLLRRSAGLRRLRARLRG